ncbi:hypothetical protein N0V93_000465 [Gnomoniopsis smithogilvyi]|uniref:Uncharacterized protein n=1 Tax=Gnomoniopsis smithogilvyi TaxID=1191159 RepID=A0A9W9D1S1_9PEZI|nr:hypothetical protein N0V93_000465 [Gnomoniopsis smithogilvyi]
MRLKVYQAYEGSRKIVGGILNSSSKVQGGMFSFFRRRPAPVPGDLVVPLHGFDDLWYYQGAIFHVLFVFDDVLDHAVLHDSLETLIRREGWQKLGARLRKQVRNSSSRSLTPESRNQQDGSGLEYHVPATFTATRPACTFNHVDHSDIPAQDHSLAKLIPKANGLDRPMILSNPAQLAGLYQAGSATKLDDFLYSDRPILGVNVTSFKDQTLVCLNWSHLAFDTMGLQEVLQGWTAVMQGRAKDVPQPFGFESDPLVEFGTGPARQTHVLADRLLSIWGLMAYLGRRAYSLTIGPSDVRMVCIPAAIFDKLREQAVYEASREAPGVQPYLSDNDVLEAFWLRLAVGSLNLAPGTTVMKQTAIDLRRILSKAPVLLPSSRPYISNAISWLVSPIPSSEILTSSLGSLARRVRGIMTQQATREQLEAYMALLRKYGSLRMLFGDPGMYLIIFSSWARAGLFEVDFGAARKKEGGRGTGKCYPVYIQQEHGPIRNLEAFFILGKDGEGNYWVSGYRAKGDWEKLERELKAFAIEVS